MNILAGLFFLLFGAVTCWRTAREVREGEAYLVTSAAGDGLLGHAGKAEQPVAFWFNVSLHALLAVAAAMGGAWILLNSTGH